MLRHIENIAKNPQVCRGLLHYITVSILKHIVADEIRSDVISKVENVPNLIYNSVFFERYTLNHFRVSGARIGLMVNGVMAAVILWSEALTVLARLEKLLIQ